MATSSFISAAILLTSTVFLQQVLLGATLEEDIFQENDTSSGSPPQACHLASHIIDFHDFHDLGEVSIVLPKSVDVGMCVGYCPEKEGPHSSNLTYYSLLRWLEDRGGEMSTSCCVPVKFKGITVFSVDYNGSTYIHILENAAVAKCGCR